MTVAWLNFKHLKDISLWPFNSCWISFTTIVLIKFPEPKFQYIIIKSTLVVMLIKNWTNRENIFFDKNLTNQLTGQHHLSILRQRIHNFIGSVKTIRPVVSDPRRMNASSSVAGFEVLEADGEVGAIRRPRTRTANFLFRLVASDNVSFNAIH